MAHGFMALAVEQHTAAPADRRGQHGKDALRRAAGQEKAVRRIEIQRRRDLSVADRAVAQIEVARAVGFGKVDRKHLGIGVEQRLALVAGHVKARGVAGREQLQRMEQRRGGKRQQPVDLAVAQLIAAGWTFVPSGHGLRLLSACGFRSDYRYSIA